MPGTTTKIDQLLQVAVQHHQAGRLAEAERTYREILVQHPNHPDALHLLGVVSSQLGRNDVAVNLIGQSIGVRPDFADAHYNLANALIAIGQPDQAIAAFRKAIALRPNSPQACNNLGNLLKAKGKLDDAIAAFRQAIALKFNYPEAHNNLGDALNDSRRLDEAIAAFHQAIALKPNYPDAYNNLGNALVDVGQSDDAIAAFRQALALYPTFFEAYNNLGSVLKDNGQLDEAFVAFRQAIALGPQDARPHSNLVFNLNYHPGFNGAAIAEEASRWNRQHAEPLKKFVQPHHNDRDPNRRLRIGYVSPDLRDHPVGRFLLPLLSQHDRRNFEIVCYAHVQVEDAMTDRLRGFVDDWRSIVGLSDAQAVELIRNDQIDLLVDLALHTAHNRLTLFARKPAPVQLTYLAYPGTSGLSTMDYRLSDPYLDPPGTDESVYSEETIRLPRTYWCFQPTDTPPIGPLPALAAAHITFGCLNKFCKVTQRTIETWVQILNAIPDSHLLLHAHQGLHRQRVVDLFQQACINPKRLRFIGKLPMIDYLNLYQQIDIALDPFPYGGGTTTCDALWMGVPVISLRGETAVGRAGFSILSNVGLPELVAASRDHYIQLATALANEPARLAELRATLRPRMQHSPLMDAPQFARDIEAAYRQVWRRWCLTER